MGDNVSIEGSEAALSGVRDAFESFITAFTGVNWKPFSEAFAEDVTFFFPFLHGKWVPYRADGKRAVEAVFGPFFEALRERDGDRAHIPITPVDVRVQLLNEIAIITFHLEDKEGLGRRTIIMERRQGRWLIVHLHASIVER